MNPQLRDEETRSSMTRRRTIPFIVTFTATVVVGVLVLTNQRRQTSSLRIELEQVRAQAAEMIRLRAENQRLRERQISDAALEALRSDHAALPRLRVELEALRSTKPAIR